MEQSLSKRRAIYNKKNDLLVVMDDDCPYRKQQAKPGGNISLLFDEKGEIIGVEISQWSRVERVFS